jgi:hypothetical protein
MKEDSTWGPTFPVVKNNVPELASISSQSKSSSSISNQSKGRDRGPSAGMKEDTTWGPTFPVEKNGVPEPASISSQSKSSSSISNQSRGRDRGPSAGMKEDTTWGPTFPVGRWGLTFPVVKNDVPELASISSHSKSSISISNQSRGRDRQQEEGPRRRGVERTRSSSLGPPVQLRGGSEPQGMAHDQQKSSLRNAALGLKSKIDSRRSVDPRREQQLLKGRKASKQMEQTAPSRPTLARTRSSSLGASFRILKEKKGPDIIIHKPPTPTSVRRLKSDDLPVGQLSAKDSTGQGGKIHRRPRGGRRASSSMSG